MKISAIVIAACLLVISQISTAQPVSGSLAGTVLHPDGSVIREAAGIDARTRSSATGQYELRNLPAGTYVLSVNMPCCEFEPFVNDDVVVGDGETHQFDILLATAELNIEGDDPAKVNAQLLSRQIIPDLPVPRTAAGRPDLSGVWLTAFDLYPEDPKALP